MLRKTNERIDEDEIRTIVHYTIRVTHHSCNSGVIGVFGRVNNTAKRARQSNKHLREQDETIRLTSEPFRLIQI